MMFDRLGVLPLAINHVASYIENRFLSLAEALEINKTHERITAEERVNTGPNLAQKRTLGQRGLCKF